MIIAIDTADMLTLIRVASKVAENDEVIKNALIRNGLMMDSEQLAFDLHQVKRVLADLDRAYPSVVPVPHDGQTWAERVPAE